MTAADIARKWVARLGYGFHPDTKGADYRPRLSPAQIREYDADMDVLFQETDPYEAAVDALQERFPDREPPVGDDH